MSQNEIVSLIILLDDSASMNRYKYDIISSLNNVFEKHRNSGRNYLVSLYKFGDSVECMTTDMPIRDIPTIQSRDYDPLGMTCLYDAIGYIFGFYGNREENLQLIIITDGEDTASNRFEMEDVRQLIGSRPLWNIVFMTNEANIQTIGRNLGIKQNLLTPFDQLDKYIDDELSELMQRM